MIKLLLVSVFILLANTQAFSGDFGDSVEEKEVKSRVTALATNPSSYVLGKIQEGVKTGTLLNLEDFYDGFERVAFQCKWHEVRIRAQDIGDKRVAVLELLINVSSALDTSTGASFASRNLFKDYINRQLAQVLGEISSSLLEIKPQQEEVMVRTLVQMGQQEARRNPSQVKTAGQWVEVFRIGRDYQQLEPYLVQDIFLNALIAYNAQEKERNLGDKDVESKVITEIHESQGLHPYPLTQDDLERFLRGSTEYTIEVSLTYSPQLFDQRGEMVNILIERGQEAAKEGRKELKTWKEEFSLGRRYEDLSLSQRQDIFLKTLIAHSAQQKGLLPKEEKGETKREAVEQVSNYFSIFDSSVIPDNLLGQLQYFQGLTQRTIAFEPVIATDILSTTELFTGVENFLDMHSLMTMPGVERTARNRLKNDRFFQLSRLVWVTHFTSITQHDDPRLKIILKLLYPEDVAYMKAAMADYLEGKIHPEKVMGLYLAAADAESKEARNALNYIAYAGKFGFTDVTKRRQYLEDRAKNGDQNAQEVLNEAAYNRVLGFTDESGHAYLKDRAKNEDQDAQELLKYTGVEGNLRSVLKYLEDCAKKGAKNLSADQNAEMLLICLFIDGEFDPTAKIIPSINKIKLSWKSGFGILPGILKRASQSLGQTVFLELASLRYKYSDTLLSTYS